MNVTKRKFNAVLQGIGARPFSSSATTDQNPNTTSSDPPLVDSEPTNSSMAADLEFLTKRRRITAPSSAPSRSHEVPNSPPQPKAGPTTISNVVLRKWTHDGGGSGSSKDGANTSSEPPRYCPGDREQLLRRLATFQELTDWTPKPDKVSEVEWAKRGWVCQGKERVRCILCNKELVVKLNRKEVDGQEVSVLVPSEIEDALVEKYLELMVTSHQEDCLWRKRGCDDSLLRLPILNPTTVLSDLRQRYDELCSRKDFLPYEFNLRLPPGIEIGQILSYLPPNFFTEPPPPTSTGSNTSSSIPNRTALALAIMGWQGLTNARMGAVLNTASCHTCLRRLGLWMFKSKEVDLTTNTVLVPAPMDHLDPLREHRFFCPWKNGAAQKPGGTSAKLKARAPADEAERPRAAYDLLVELLKNEAHLRNRASGAAHGRSKSSVPYGSGTAGTPVGTPARPTTATTPGGTLGEKESVVVLGPDGREVEVDDAAAREAKDKERWARLRKVKSFFNSKDGKKLRRPMSRPGTGHSSIGGGE